MNVNAVGRSFASTAKSFKNTSRNVVAAAMVAMTPVVKGETGGAAQKEMSGVLSNVWANIERISSGNIPVTDEFVKPTIETVTNRFAKYTLKHSDTVDGPFTNVVSWLARSLDNDESVTNCVIKAMKKDETAAQIDQGAHHWCFNVEGLTDKGKTHSLDISAFGNDTNFGPNAFFKVDTTEENIVLTGPVSK